MYSLGIKKLFFLVASASLLNLAACNTAEEIELNGYETNAEIVNGKLVDSRDGNEYAVTLIAGVYWMAENLRYADSTSMINLKVNSWCHKDDKKCTKYGRLYSWTAAMDLDNKFLSTYGGRNNGDKTQGICPAGWYLPSLSDWQTLRMNVDLYNNGEGAGTSLKSIKTWDEFENVPAPTNRFGFNALASGRRNNDGETFLSTGQTAFFWSSTEKDAGTAYGMQLRNDIELLLEGNFYKDHGLSVRCIANNYNVRVTGALDSSFIEEIPHNYGTLKINGQSYRTIEIKGVTWMADNMNLDVKGSHCYNDDMENCKKFGRLYTYEAAKSVCPDGWTLPSSSVFSKLASVVSANVHLRSTTSWIDKASRGLNSWGFDAKAAGGRESSGYFDLKTSAYFWLSDTAEDDKALAVWINYYSAPSTVTRSASDEFSVRCVKE